MSNKIAFYDFSSLSMDKFKLNFEDLTVKPNSCYWEISKVSDDKNYVMRTSKEEVNE